MFNSLQHRLDSSGCASILTCWRSGTYTQCNTNATQTGLRTKDDAKLWIRLYIQLWGQNAWFSSYTNTFYELKNSSFSFLLSLCSFSIHLKKKNLHPEADTASQQSRAAEMEPLNESLMAFRRCIKIINADLFSASLC